MDTKELEDSYELTVGDAKKAVCKISKELKTVSNNQCRAHILVQCYTFHIAYALRGSN